MLARAGVPVTLIGRVEHVKAIERDGLQIESADYHDHIRANASTDLRAVADADYVLLCVKTLHTVSAMNYAVPHLRAGVHVVSLQNGVDNVNRLRQHLGIEAIPSVVWVAAEMVGPGHVKHNGRGDLVMPNRPEVSSLAAAFERAGVPCRLSANIDAELWTKMIINCAYNAISALTRSSYGMMLRNPTACGLMTAVVGEALAVAGGLGVALDPAATMDTVWKLGDAMQRATSSTAQDLERGRFTEVDSLNGYIADRAAELGLAAPVNRTLHGLVKHIEFAMHPPVI
jgi:2-dehydropantoate 2-reductase